MKVSCMINGVLVVRDIRDKDYKFCQERGWKEYSENRNGKEMLEKNEGENSNKKKRHRRGN